MAVKKKKYLTLLDKLDNQENLTVVKEDDKPVTQTVENMGGRVRLKTDTLNVGATPTKTNYTTTTKKQSETEKEWWNEFFKESQSDNAWETALHSTADVILNMGNAIGNTIEGVVDLPMHIDAGINKGLGWLSEKTGDLTENVFGEDNAVSKILHGMADTQYAEAEKVKSWANYEAVNSVMKEPMEYYDKNSVFGDTSDAVARGIGQTLTFQLGGGLLGKAGNIPVLVGKLKLNIPTTALLSGTGSGISEAYNSNENIKDWQAWLKGTGAGTIEGIAEGLFGMFNIGGSSLDDALVNSVTKYMKTGLTKALVKVPLKSAGEGVEEIVSYAGNYILDHGIDLMSQITGDTEVKLGKEWNNADMWESFFTALLSSMIMQGGSTTININQAQNNAVKEAEKQLGRQLTSDEKSELKKQISLQLMQSEENEITMDEQKVVNSVVENRVAEQGKTLSTAELNAIRDQVVSDLKKGYISTTDIENTLLSKDNAEITALHERLAAETDPKARADIETLINLNEINKQTNLENLLKDNQLLQESYNEQARKSEAFTYDNSQELSEQRKSIYADAQDLQLNNTRRTHETLDMIANIAEDRGTKYRIVNSAKLKELGFIETANGLVTNDGEVLINVDSKKALNAIVGHETTHLLEKAGEYDKLQTFAIEYAKAKGEYETRLQSINKLYQGKNANVYNELTADIVGDYLFTDEQFINRLSTEKPGIFKRIYNYIKHVYKMATAGSEEARQLEQLKHKVEQAYRNSSKQANTDTKYSLSDNIQEKHTKDYWQDISGKPASRTEFSNENGRLVVMERGDGVNSIFETYVKPESRNQGLGTKLLNEAINKYKDTNLVGQFSSEQSVKNAYKLGFRTEDNASLEETLARQKEDSSVYMKYQNNTKYSLTDNQGRELSKGQQTYFKDSKVRDEQGNLVTAYHTMTKAGSQFNIFDPRGTDGYRFGDQIVNFYTNSKEMSNSYARNKAPTKANTDRNATQEELSRKAKYQYEGYVNITNPYVIDAEGKTWNKVAQEYSKELHEKYNSLTQTEKDTLSKIAAQNGRIGFKMILDEAHKTSGAEFTHFEDKISAAEAKNLASAYEKLIGTQNIFAPSLNDVFYVSEKNFDQEAIEIYSEKELTTNDIVFKVLEANKNGANYDGVIIKNTIDYGYIVSNPTPNDLYITFKSNQFKASDNLNPTDDPDIRYSLSEDGSMVDSKGNKVTLEATDTGKHGTLMAIHNLNEGKLKGILELGGFPVPSIAIANPNILDHTQFGDVSVIFDKSAIDPANRKNEVYDRDVWSPTFPEVHYDINNGSLVDMKVENNIYNDYSDDVASKALNRYFDASNLRDLIDRYGLDGTLQTLKGSKELKYVYKRTIDKNFVPAMKEKEISYNASNKAIRRFLDTYKGKPINELSNSEVTALGEFVADLQAQLEIESNPEAYKDEEIRNELKAIYKDIYVDNFSKMDMFIYDVRKYQRAVDNNNGNIPTTVDTETTFKQIEQEINQQEYEKWVDKTFGNLFANAKKGIRNNKDIFTPSGNRRSFNQLHDEYNLQNIVKAMIKQSTIAGQKGFFEGGFGKTSAHLSTKFNSIQDIKNAENRLMSSDKANEIVQPLADQLNEDMRVLLDYHKKTSSYKSDFVSGLEAFEHISGAVEEFAGKRNLTTETFRKVLDGWYSFETDKIPNEVLQKIIDDLNALKTIPTDYFEAKPQRAVGLDEVQAIVVPNDIDAELKQQLINSGLNVIEYDSNIEGDRQAKINELDEYKFSLSEPDIAPTGSYNVYGEDLKLQVQEAIAPLQETITGLTEQVETLQEQLAPVERPTTMQGEIEHLINLRDNSSGSEYASAFFELKKKYGAKNFYKALNNFYSGIAVETGLQEDIPTTGPVNVMEKEYTPDALTDEDIAPLAEDTTPEATEDASVVESPFDNRDIDEVGKRNVKAYQYENPEVKPFFREMAEYMLNDLNNTIKGERTFNSQAYYDTNGEAGWYGTERQTTDDIAYLKDHFGYSYAQIEEGLKKIIEDDGKENNAVSKRIEFMLDERLREGYVDVSGVPIPPNEEYINLLRGNEIANNNVEAFKTLDDGDIPLIEKEPIPDMPKTQKTSKKVVKDQITPKYDARAREAWKDVIDELEDERIAIEQYEAIEPKPADNNYRMKRVASETNANGDKMRRWVKTSTESDVVNRKVLPDDLDQSKIFYQVKSNVATLSTANAKLDALGYEKAIDYFNNQVSSQKVSVEDITLGERLIQEAIKLKDTETAGELIQNVAILGTELGQKVQALSIIQRMTPEGQLRMLQKVVDRGKVKGDKAFTGVELTQEMIDKILNTYNKDGSYDQEALNKAVEDVKKKLADQMEVTAMDKINAWRYLAMLGNPKTHIRNLVSNVAMKGTLAAKNAVARTIETIAPIENRTRTWKPSSDEVKTFAEKTTLEMKDEISGDSKYNEEADIKRKRQTFKNKVLNGVYEFNSDLLENEDWWFSKGAFRSSFAEYLTANGIETQEDIKNNPEIIEKGKLYATEQAQIATFRQYSWLANKLREFENKNVATQVAVGSVIPFKKTPINIAKTGLSYSPLGFAKTLTYDIAQVKKGNMEASTLVDHLAQNLTGTGLALLGYMLASSGFLNGAGDDDKEGKYDYYLGKQAYSVNIGGNTYSLSWLSPVAMPLFVGANAYEQMVEGKEWNGDVVLETLAQTLDPLSEMSFLSSLDSVLSSYDTGIQKFAGIGETALQSYITQFVPTLSSQIASTLDDTKRSTKVSGDSSFKLVEETYNKLIYKIPFLREALEPSTDIWGNEVKQSENLFTRAFESFISPYSRKENIATDIDEELKDLFSQTGDNGIIPNIPYNYVNYDGEKYNMSAKEYTDFKTTYGQTANDLLEDLFNTTTYQTATSEEKTDMVNDVYDYARDVAKLDYLAKEGVDYTNATSDGVDYYKENSIKGAIEHDMPVDEYRYYLENPSKHLLATTIADYETYRGYASDLYDLKADKDENGKSINGSRKEKVIDYVNNLDIDYGQKIILFKSEYNADDTYNQDIIDYLNDRDDISYEQMRTILVELGFEITDDGNIYWD